ncbi:MAG: hypothetical protein WD055_04860 [Candidatus Dependentiae bacterium]
MHKKLLCLVLLMDVYNVWSADPDVYSSGSSSEFSSGWGTQEEQ